MQIPKRTVFVSYFERKSGHWDDRFLALQAKLWFGSLPLRVDTANRIHRTHSFHLFLLWFREQPDFSKNGKASVLFNVTLCPFSAQRLFTGPYRTARNAPLSLGKCLLGAQSAFEHGREVGVADVIEAIELQAAGAQDLKTSVAASGFVRQPEHSLDR